jgi:hypothetical protein
MKSFTFAFVLLALAIPASAAEISTAAPAMTPVQQAVGTVTPLELGSKILPPRCWTLQGTSCSSFGSTTACTDDCQNRLSCSCTYYYTYPYGHPSDLFWNCSLEC